MLGWALALLLTVAPPDADAPPNGDTGVAAEVEASAEVETPSDEPSASASASASEALVEPELAPGKLLLIPNRAERVQIVDGEQRVLWSAEVGPQQPAEVELPPGIYYVQDATGVTVAVAVLTSTQPLVWDGERVVSAVSWERSSAPSSAPTQAIPPPSSTPTPTPARQRNPRLWAAPLASTLVPGSGQLINRQAGKGLTLMFGTLAAVLGASLLYRLDNDGRRPAPAEYSRLIGYGVLSTAAPALWIYAIADAYRVAAGRSVEPHLDHRLRLSVSRTMTLGFRADVRRPGFYDNWSGALMGQATRRLTVGVADLSFSPGGRGVTQIGQFGLRLDYRVLERPRLWLDVGAGTAMQIATRRDPRPLDPTQPQAKRELAFAAIPYGYLDLRCFVLDRLSVDFTPRLSVPVTTRYFSANRSLPRFAPSLELGAGVSAYF
ncbi:MAG: hypothetical protein R6X02_03010 [Enhygromyxa sp.]